MQSILDVRIRLREGFEGTIMKIMKKFNLKDFLIDLLIGIISFLIFLVLFINLEWDAVFTAAAIIGAGELVRKYIREGRK